MLGFSQNSQFTGSLMLGFTVESEFNALVRVKDNFGTSLENALVILNGIEGFTNAEGYIEFDVAAGAYEVSVTSSPHQPFEESGTYTEGILIIDATLSTYPQGVYPFMAAGGDLLWSPVLNSIRFRNSLDQSFMDRVAFDDLAKQNWMWFANYCQKVQLDETRTIQFHSNGTAPTVYLKDWDTDAIITSIAAESVGSSTKESHAGTIAFEYWNASIGFTTVGRYYMTIETNGGANVITSEPIIVGDFIDSVLIEFTNDKNTDLNVWTNLSLTLRVEAQFFKRKPGSIRTVFVDSANKGQILSQRNQRGMMMELFQLPPYLHEQLSYGFSLNKCYINGQYFYSEEGYEQPDYIERYSLANATVSLLTAQGFNQDFGKPPSPTAPTGLAAYLMSDCDVELTWGQSTILGTAIEVEHSTDGVNFTVLATLAQDATEYGDYNIAQGVDKWYRVRALGSPNSDWSNIVSVDLPLVGVGATGLTVTGISATEILASWDYPSFDGETKVTYSYDPAFSSSQSVTVAEGVNEFVIGGSIVNTERYVKIEKTVWTCSSGVVSTKPLFSFQTNHLGSGSFDPQITYTGTGTPSWKFENGYEATGASPTIDEVAAGLDGTTQNVELIVAEADKVTAFSFTSDNIVGTFTLNSFSALQIVSVGTNAELDKIHMEEVDLLEDFQLTANSCSILTDVLIKQTSNVRLASLTLSSCPLMTSFDRGLLRMEQSIVTLTNSPIPWETKAGDVYDRFEIQSSSQDGILCDVSLIDIDGATGHLNLSFNPSLNINNLPTTFTGGMNQCYLTSTLKTNAMDLSGYTWKTNCDIQFQNLAMTSLIPPTNLNNCTRYYPSGASALTDTVMDLSTLVATGTLNLQIHNIPSITSVTAPPPNTVIGFIYLYGCNITGVLNFSQVSFGGGAFAQIFVRDELLMTDIILAAQTAITGTLDFNGSNIQDWTNVITSLLPIPVDTSAGARTMSFHTNGMNTAQVDATLALCNAQFGTIPSSPLTIAIQGNAPPTGGAANSDIVALAAKNMPVTHD